MQKQELINTIENYAPLSNQAVWDYSGIQIDSFKDKFSHLAVMLDPTWENIEKAIEQGADAILSHHPLTMGEYRLNICSALFKSIHLLLSKNVFLYAAHTSLDATFNGFAFWLAEDLKLQELLPLDEEENFGAIGLLENSRDISDVLECLEKSMPFISRKDFRLVGKNTQRKIKKIAFCFGSGSSLYEKAKEKGADLFITGDVKYHLALDIVGEYNPLSEYSQHNQEFENPLLLDVGHFSLEEEMMKRFANHLKNYIPVKVSFIEGTNPFCSLV